MKTNASLRHKDDQLSSVYRGRVDGDEVSGTTEERDVSKVGHFVTLVLETVDPWDPDTTPVISNQPSHSNPHFDFAVRRRRHLLVVGGPPTSHTDRE